ncbi:alpha/beta hydrolase family protein [Streptomyces sp. LZ34]
MTTYTTGRGPHRSEPTASAPLAAPASAGIAAPTGPYPVGMISLPLVDRDRPESGVRSKPFRELTVDVRYPAREVERYERTPGTFVHEDAPPALDPSGPRPVVLHSPGVGEAYAPSPLAEELASHGYVVVTIVHDDARVDGFPYDRVADVRFVLDQLVSLAPGVLDLSRIGLFGRSAGCLAGLEAGYDDPRIKAVADLDGNLAAVWSDDRRAPLVAFFDRRLRGRQEEAFAATAVRAGR